MTALSKMCLAAVCAVAFPLAASADHVLGYQFEEGIGTITADSESTVFGDQFGTLVNGASFSPNISTRTPGSFSLELDGVDDSVVINNSGDLLRNIAAATISVFINIDAFPGAGAFDSVVFLSNTTNTGNQARLTLQIGENGSIALGGRRADGDGFSRYTSATGVISLNTTHHIAGTVNFASGSAVVSLYVDGAPVTIAAPGSFSAGTVFSNTTGFIGRVGAQGGGGAEFVDGTIDDVKIWQRALSASEIANQAVPEPASALLICGAGGLLALRRRRAPGIAL